MRSSFAKLVARTAAIAERTADAYSWDAYGARRWHACAIMLVRRGYSDREVEAILRSKWTRWAGDMASGRGRKYGYVNSEDLSRFLETMTPEVRAVRVAELVAGTFGGDE